MLSGFRPTLKQIFAISLLGLTAGLGLLYYVFSEGSQRTILQSAERFRDAASREAATHVTDYLNRAPMAAGQFEEQIRYGLVDPRKAASVESGLLSLLLSNQNISEASFTSAKSTGFNQQGEIQVQRPSAAEITLYRSPDGAHITAIHTWYEGNRFVAESHPVPAVGNMHATAVVPDPTDHPTFLTPASRRLYGRLLWTDLHWSQLDANLPQSQRKVEVSVQKTIDDSRHEFAGVLRLGLSKAEIDRTIDLHLSGTGNADAHLVFLCDNTGRLIAGPGVNRVVESGDDLRIANEGQPKAVVEALQQTALKSIDFDQQLATTSFLMDRETYLVTFRFLPGTQDWIVGIVVPRSFYLQGLLHTRQRVLLATLALIAGIVLLGGFILRRVGRAHSLLVRETSRMNSFEFAPTPDRSPLRDINEVLEGMERAKTAMRAMGKYVPLDLVRRLYHEGKEPELGGETVELSILFTDIKDFTTFAEKIEPHHLAEVLGVYLQTLTMQIQKQKGTIDKYIGDSVMAFWNAPEPVAYHTVLACHAAINCLRALDELFASSAWKDMPRFETRFGLHRGTVSVGHFGALDRFNYTAIGDGVNLASRLEGLNKQYGTAIIVSETIYELVSDHFEFRRLDRVSVKGKTQGINVYELLGEKLADAERPAYIARYEQALKAYMDGDFSAALEMFSSSPEDAPSAAMAERCRSLIHTPPPGVWDGTYALHTK